MAQPAQVKNDPLDGVRGTPIDGNAVPQPVDDHAGTPSPVTPPEHEGRVPTGTPIKAQSETPPTKVDPRQELAARFQRNRAEKRADVVPNSFVPSVDGDNPLIPGYVGPDESQMTDEEIEAAAVAREEAESAAAARRARQAVGVPPEVPAAADQPKTYSLTVDRNTFQVTRDQLLQYAEVEPSEAGDYSEVALTRLAQKHIAASARLAEAREAREQARRDTALNGSGRPADPQQAQPRSVPQPVNQPVPDDLVEAIKEVQYGDPAEAAAKVQRIVLGAIDNRLGSYDQGRRQMVVDEEYRGAISDFEKNNQDIVANPVYAAAHIGIIAREIADDIYNLGLIDERKYATIATDPALAAKVMKAAIIEGQPVRRPNQIFEAATQKLDQAFGRTRSSPAPIPQPASAQPSRTDLKRTLPPQPARSGSPQSLAGQSPPAPIDRNARNQAVLNQMRVARHQTAG